MVIKQASDAMNLSMATNQIYTSYDYACARRNFEDLASSIVEGKRTAMVTLPRLAASWS